MRKRKCLMGRHIFDKLLIESLREATHLTVNACALNVSAECSRPSPTVCKSRKELDSPPEQFQPKPIPQRVWQSLRHSKLRAFSTGDSSHRRR